MRHAPVYETINIKSHVNTKNPISSEKRGFCYQHIAVLG